MPSKLVGSVFHPFRAPLLVHKRFAQRTESAGVTAKECKLLLQTEPVHIIRWGFAGKPFHRCGIVLEKGDSVALCYLIWAQGSFLPPLVKYFFGLLETAHDHERSACIGKVRSSRYQRKVNCPLELSQSLFGSAHVLVSESQYVGSNRAAWIRFLVQNQYSNCLFQVSRSIHMINTGSPKVFFLRDTAIL